MAYVFVRPLDPSKPAFSKKLHSRDRFWKPAFFVPENAVCARKAKTEKKNVRFQKYRDKCGQGLRLVNGLLISYNKADALFLYERRFSHSCNLYSKFLNFFVLPPSSKYLWNVSNDKINSHRTKINRKKRYQHVKGTLPRPVCEHALKSF